MLKDDFVGQTNEICGTLLDYGDIDYFDASQYRIRCSALYMRSSV